MLSYRMAEKIINQITSSTRFLTIPHRYIIKSIKIKMIGCHQLNDGDEKKLKLIETRMCMKDYKKECICEANRFKRKKCFVFSDENISEECGRVYRNEFNSYAQKMQDM